MTDFIRLPYTLPVFPLIKISNYDICQWEVMNGHFLKDFYLCPVARESFGLWTGSNRSWLSHSFRLHDNPNARNAFGTLHSWQKIAYLLSKEIWEWGGRKLCWAYLRACVWFLMVNFKLKCVMLTCQTCPQTVHVKSFTMASTLVYALSDDRLTGVEFAIRSFRLSANWAVNSQSCVSSMLI